MRTLDLRTGDSDDLWPRVSPVTDTGLAGLLQPKPYKVEWRPLKLSNNASQILFNPSGRCRSYCRLNHFSLRFTAMWPVAAATWELAQSWSCTRCWRRLSLQVWLRSVCPCDATMQKYRESQSVNPKPMSQIICSLLCYLSLSAHLWSHSTRPFVFCSCSAVLSLSQHASMSAALPTGSWFMNHILVCHYCLQ